MRAACLDQLILLDLTILIIWRGVQIMQLHIMQFYPASSHFIPSQHPVLPLIPQTEIHTHAELKAKFQLFILIFCIFIQLTRRQEILGGLMQLSQ
jgi:hypothetical protein